MWNSIKYLLVAVFFKINSIVINADIIIDDSFGSPGVLQGPNFKITELGPIKTPSPTFVGA